jgi:hypothetical protein
MTEKEALLWKQQYTERTIFQNGKLVWPTFEQFATKLKKDFKYKEQIRDAMTLLKTIQQGKQPAEELITEFKLLVGQAGLMDETTFNNNYLIRLF